MKPLRNASVPLKASLGGLLTARRLMVSGLVLRLEMLVPRSATLVHHRTALPLPPPHRLVLVGASPIEETCEI